MNTSRLITSLAIASSVIFSGAALNTALAQTNTTQVQTTQVQKQLNIKQVYDKVEAAGYTNITEIELDDNYYEVKARNQQDQRTKLKVNINSGEIMETKIKDK